MKVEVKNKIGESDIKYPCLMRSVEYNCIVLFSQYKCGVCIESSSIQDEKLKYSENWDMSAFVPFEGEVTLKND